MAWTKGKPKSVDDYLSALPPEQRGVLSKLRSQILRVFPRAEPCISYSIPAFRVDGKVVAGFLATAKGFSFFPFSGTTLATLAAELTAYDQTKSALHFTARGLPQPLVRKLLSARQAETQGSGAPRRATAKKGQSRAKTRKKTKTTSR
jgi:uncharacterized protein YdhG (YjbR/CyaY superfamily)